MSDRVLRVVAAAWLAVVILSASAYPLYAQELSYTVMYRMFGDGSALVTLNVLNTTGLVIVEVPVYEQVDPDSIVVFDEEGVVLPHDYNGSHIIVYSFNSSSLTLQYVALVGTLIDVVVDAVIKPQGPSTVLLPRGSALLTFNGTPTISYIGDVISLRYQTPGTYMISYILLGEEENATATATTITETATVTETHTLTLTTTETVTQQIIIPQTTTVTETRTETATTTRTLTLLERTTETVREVETVTRTETKTAPPQTVTVEKGPGMEVAAAIILAAVGGAALAYLLARRFTGSAGEELAVESIGVDERDRSILKLLKDNPMNISELSRASGYSKSTVWRRVRRLEKMGLVKLDPRGNTVYIALTEEGEKALEQPGTS